MPRKVPVPHQDDPGALNAALRQALGIHAPIAVDAPTQDYCQNLHAAVQALNALGLDWTKDEHDTSPTPRHPQVYVIRRGNWLKGCTAWAANTTPEAIATALVQAALAVLEQPDKENGHHDD